MYIYISDMYICISGCGIRLDPPQDLQLRVELRGSRIMSAHKPGAPVPARDFSCGTAQGRVVWCCCCYHSVSKDMRIRVGKSQIKGQNTKRRSGVTAVYLYKFIYIYLHIMNICIYIYFYLFTYHRYNFESDFAHSKLDVLIKYEVPLTFK